MSAEAPSTYGDPRQCKGECRGSDNIWRSQAGAGVSAEARSIYGDPREVQGGAGVSAEAQSIYGEWMGQSNSRGSVLMAEPARPVQGLWQ